MLSNEDRSKVNDSMDRVERRVFTALQAKPSARLSIYFLAVLHENVDKTVQK